MHQFFLYVFKHLYLVRGLNDARNATILTICGYNQKCNRSRIKRSKNLHDMWILNVTSYLPSQLHLWVAQSYQLTFVCVSYNVLLLPFLSRDWDPLLEFLCENFVSVLLWDWQHIKKEIQWLTTLFLSMYQNDVVLIRIFLTNWQTIGSHQTPFIFTKQTK